MTTPVDELPDTDDRAAGPLGSHRRALLAAAAAVLLLVALAVGFALSGSDDDLAPADDPAAVTLGLPGGDAMSSCVVFDEAILADLPLAFRGTATAVSDGTVRLSVDRWYRSGPAGEAAEVQLRTPDAQTSAVLDGVAFTEGERYLVTGTNDGMVNGCGFSGLATPQLEASFERAFG